MRKTITNEEFENNNKIVSKTTKTIKNIEEKVQKPLSEEYNQKIEDIVSGREQSPII